MMNLDYPDVQQVDFAEKQFESTSFFMENYPTTGKLKQMYS